MKGNLISRRQELIENGTFYLVKNTPYARASTTLEKGKNIMFDLQKKPS
jgi:hypothetical protein